MTLSPEVHVECEVHELLTDLRHGEDVQRHAHGHRLAPVVRTHAAVIADLDSYKYYRGYLDIFLSTWKLLRMLEMLTEEEAAATGAELRAVAARAARLSGNSGNIVTQLCR